MHSKKTRCAVLFLLFALYLTSTSLAYAPEPDEINASYYIADRYAACSATGNGKVKVAFDLFGTGVMSMIGATTINVYKSNGTCVATYTYYNYSSMMGYNKEYHSSSITYYGTSGQSYYATVTVYARNSTGSDSRTITTNTVTA